MFYKALLLLLPVAYAQVNIRVEAVDDYRGNNNYNELSYRHSGSAYSVITETGLQTWQWQINEEKFNKLVQFCSHILPNQTRPRPEDVLVSPTPLGDKLYQYFRHEDLRFIMKEGLESKGIRYEPVMLATEEFYNNKDITVNYTVGKIEQSIEETVSTIWRTPDSELKIEKVDYEFIVRKWNVPDFSFIGSWGKNATISKTATVVSESGVAVELKPGELVVAALIASRGTMEINLKFQAFLLGNVVVPYRKRAYYYNNSHDFLVMKKCQKLLPEVEIKFVFYADPQIVVCKNWTRIPVHHKHNVLI